MMVRGGHTPRLAFERPRTSTTFWCRNRAIPEAYARISSRWKTDGTSWIHKGRCICQDLEPRRNRSRTLKVGACFVPHQVEVSGLLVPCAWSGLCIWAPRTCHLIDGLFLLSQGGLLFVIRTVRQTCRTVRHAGATNAPAQDDQIRAGQLQWMGAMLQDHQVGNGNG